MTVQITPKSIQHTGLAPSMEGSVAAWEVMFELDGDESVYAAISFPLAGPPSIMKLKRRHSRYYRSF
jgi:hypothetical protein